MLTFNGNPQLKQELLNRLEQVAGQIKDRDLQVDRPHWSKLLGLNRLEYKLELCADRLGVPLSLMLHETYIYRQLDTAAEARHWVESFINALPVNARINERAIVISMALACIEDPEHGLLCLQAAQKARAPLMKVAELIRSNCTIANDWQSAIKMLGQCVQTIACPEHLTSSDWLQAMVLNVTIEAATSLANYFLHDHQHGFASGLALRNLQETIKARLISSRCPQTPTVQTLLLEYSSPAIECTCFLVLPLTDIQSIVSASKPVQKLTINCYSGRPSRCLFI
ncbi:MAG: hypothetical protein IPI39_11095 [Candidatus Obscuribacter sp.]|nr:hypothetical protein [Candidatus Obscuribacter sp.]